jgi:hypothetical protein
MFRYNSFQYLVSVPIFIYNLNSNQFIYFDFYKYYVPMSTTEYKLDRFIVEIDVQWYIDQI